MPSSTGRVKALGEIALRVHDLDKMQAFYQEVIGLALMGRFEHAAFFKIADGYGGHTQILALFDRSAEPGYRGLDAARTTVDHIAFNGTGKYASSIWPTNICSVPERTPPPKTRSLLPGI